MTLCDTTCQDQYINWTSYGTFSIDRAANQSFTYTAVIDKIPGLYNGVDNRLMKVTVTFNQGLNDQAGISPSHDTIVIDSLNDGLPNIQFNTTNTAYCPDWLVEGICTFYFEINKTYSTSSVRSEDVMLIGASLPWYYTASVNLHNPPKIISYRSELSGNSSISVGTESRKIMGYIKNFFTYLFEIGVILFWLCLLTLLIASILLVFVIINYAYSWLRRHIL